MHINLETNANHTLHYHIAFRLGKSYTHLRSRNKRPGHKTKSPSKRLRTPNHPAPNKHHIPCSPTHNNHDKPQHNKIHNRLSDIRQRTAQIALADFWPSACGPVDGESKRDAARNVDAVLNHVDDGAEDHLRVLAA